MIADGVSVDLYSLQKIKFHLLQVVGFEEVITVATATGEGFSVTFANLGSIPEIALPCISELSTVLDAVRPFKLAPSAMGGPNGEDDEPWPLLVGSIFVDIALALFCEVKDMLSLPILVVKAMLESLLIIVYKHDFDCKTLKHLQHNLRKAVRRVMDLLLQDLCYELRQLSLTVIQAFIKRWQTFAGGII